MNVNTVDTSSTGNQGLLSTLSNDSYTVAHGDTLSDIAATHGVSLARLTELNPQIRNPDHIYPGEQIRLPADTEAQRYTVQSGDSLSAIANSHGVSLADLIKANPQIHNPDVIYPGEKLTIPAPASGATGSGAGSTAPTNPGGDASGPMPGTGASGTTTGAGAIGTGTAAGGAGNNPLAKLIARGESGGAGYNAYNRGSAGDSSKPVDLTNMTVGEVMRQQQAHELFAVGKYQLIPQTLSDAVKQLGINPNEKFSPQLQEKLFSHYLIDVKRPAIKDYITGNGSLVDAQRALSREFASVADPDKAGTQSHYGGIGGNSASISNAESASALESMRASYQHYLGQGMTPAQAWQATNNG